MKLSGSTTVCTPMPMHQGVFDLSALGWTKHEAVAYIKTLKTENDLMSAAASDVPHLRLEVDALKNAVRRRDTEIEELRKEVGALARAVLSVTIGPSLHVPKSHRFLTDKSPVLVTIAPPTSPE